MPLACQTRGVLRGEVSSLIVDVADRVVMPRFRRLTPGEVTEKSPGELVTRSGPHAPDEGGSARGDGCQTWSRQLCSGS